MNELLTHFHFLRPWWLVAIIPALALAAALFHIQRRNSQWTQLIDKNLLPYLLDGEFSKAQKAPIYGLIFIWSVATISLAGPTWEKKPEPVQKDISAMVILWDLSPSMLAQDIKPSRLVRSRLKLVDLLDKRREGLTALVAYGGDAHVVTPLTDDSATIKSLLPGLSPSMMPVTGSNPEAAFELAHQLLTETGVIKGDIVFLTDGIAADAIDELASTAQNSNHRITVWGIGSEDGAPIPLPSGGFAKNNRGEIVVAKVDDNILSEAASRMGGIFVPFSNDKLDIDTVSYFGITQEQSQTQENTRVFDRWIERGHWLLILILPVVALSFRRGWLLCLCLGVFSSPQSQAFSFEDLWKTKDQQGQVLLEAQDPEAAASTFKNEDWKAIAEYRAGNFEAAKTQFEQGDNANAKYNYGNALTQLGNYDDAINAYQAALDLDPSFEAAQKNKAIAEQLKSLEEQQQNQQDQQDGESGESQEQDNQQQEGQQSDNQQQSDQQSGEGTSSDQQSNSQESSDGQEGQSQEQLSDAQKEALDQQYNSQTGENDASDEQEESTLAEDQQKQEGDDQQTAMAQQNEGDQDQNEQQVNAMMQMSDAEKEQQQALEQWLRRVPDDPSGLLRNKFRHEYEKRRRESQQSQLRSPNTTPEERW